MYVHIQPNRFRRSICIRDEGEPMNHYHYPIPEPTLLGCCGPQGERGEVGLSGPQGAPGSTVSVTEITMGKLITELLSENIPFTASVNAPYNLSLVSTADVPASLYNTWSVDFDGVLVPLAKLEGLYLSFATLRERASALALLDPILESTLECTCPLCPDVLAVDSYNAITSMPADCDYQYYLDRWCRCSSTAPSTYARRLNLGDLANTTGEKLRGILERKQAESTTVEEITTQKSALFTSTSSKHIHSTGLAAVALTYQENSEYALAFVALDCVQSITFTET